MIFCSLSSALFIEEFNTNEKENIFINLFNWIPLFILFICSNFYLNNLKKKNIFKVLNCKYSSDNFKLYFTILVCIHGVFRTLNGLIVWYIDKVNYSEITISGLFSNRNYTGIWLSSVLAFSFYEFKTVNDSWYRKLFVSVFNLLMIYFTIYTFSRNAIIGIVIILVISFNKYRFIYPLFLIYTLLNLIILNLPYNFYLFQII